MTRDQVQHRIQGKTKLSGFLKTYLQMKAMTIFTNLWAKPLENQTQEVGSLFIRQTQPQCSSSPVNGTGSIVSFYTCIQGNIWQSLQGDWILSDWYEGLMRLIFFFNQSLGSDLPWKVTSNLCIWGKPSGSVECWFESDILVHEWFMYLRGLCEHERLLWGVGRSGNRCHNLHLFTRF